MHRPLSALISCIAVVAFAVIPALDSQARHHHSKSNHQGQPGQFDYYVLSLSWAPTYCLTHADDGEECSSKGFGFVLHGLWPQYDSGGYPEQCDSEFELSSEAAAKGRTIYPSERLMFHEWQEHGTCSGLRPLEYFHAADRATAAIRIPAAFEAPRAEETLTAEQIIDQFRSANPSAPDGAMALACSRAVMSEIRVCLTKDDLRVRSCGRGVNTRCPKVPLTVPASR
jgi:ribonuclease T2